MRYEPFSQSWHFQLGPLHDRCWGLTIDLKWTYGISHSKSCIVTFGETKPQHSESLKNLEGLLGDIKVEELYKYENIGVLKNYVGSFSSNIDDNTDKTGKKVDMMFSFNFDRHKINPIIYVKFWRQACLPMLLYGAALFTVTPALLLRLGVASSLFSKIFSVFQSLHLVLYFKNCRV